MPDYREGVARGTGLICTPAGVVRNDAGGDLAGANLAVVEQQADSAGCTRVNPEGMKTTYVMSFVNVALAANATDALLLIGSASKTIKITRCEFALSDTTGASTIADLILNLRSTLDTAGTLGTAPPIAPVDPSSPAATATARLYTANPTTGNLACTLRAQKLALLTPAATTPATDSVIWTFGTEPGAEQPTLRGVNNSLCVNFNASALGTGPTLSGTITFTEEPNTA